MLAYRHVLLSQIPKTEKIIPVRVDREEIPVPKRPGTRSIRIVGPPLKVLKFEIDFNRNPLPIDWELLERMDRRADVMLEGAIGENGSFVITKLRDRGHPKAGQYIQTVLRSWRFTPYRTGTIRYYFNVPTRLESMKVQIDLRRMQKNFRYIGPYHHLQDGILCFVKGLDSNSIKILSEN